MKYSNKDLQLLIQIDGLEETVMNTSEDQLEDESLKEQWGNARALFINTRPCIDYILMKLFPGNEL